MAGGSNGARRADLAHRIERAFSAALTETLFADDDDDRPGELMRAAMQTIRSQGRDTDAAEVLTRAGWSSPLLSRVPAQTLLGDVAGALSNPSAAGSVPDEVIARVRRRQASTQRMIDALTVDLPLGARPWIPGPPTPPVAGPEQATELTDLGSRTISVTGQYQTPALIGRAADLAWQIGDASDAVLEIVAADAHYSVGQWLVGKLQTAAGTAVADVKAAVAAIEAAGWTPDLILTPLSRVDRVSTALGEVGVAALRDTNLIVAPVGVQVFVVATAGVDARVSEQATARIAEPSIGAQEVSVSYWGTFTAGANAVKRVTA